MILPLDCQIRAVGLPLPVAEYAFAENRKWRLDYAYPELLLGIEVEGGTWIPGGGRHNRPRGYEADCRKYNRLAIMGWRLLRFTTAMVASGEALKMLEEALRDD